MKYLMPQKKSATYQLSGLMLIFILSVLSTACSYVRPSAESPPIEQALAKPTAKDKKGEGEVTPSIPLVKNSAKLTLEEETKSQAQSNIEFHVPTNPQVKLKPQVQAKPNSEKVTSTQTGIEVTKKPQAAKPVIKKNKVKPKPKKKTVIALSSFVGQVKLLGSAGETLSPEGIIVLLEPEHHTGHVIKKTNSAMIDMFSKQYTPTISTVSTMQTIQFRNRDQVKHNVFSSSATNSFDLGTYGKGKVGKVQFKQEGIVKVYCNIHPDMVALIGVSQYNYSALANKKGQFSIAGLPAGKYKLTVWSPRGELKKSIYISENKANKKNFTLNTAQYKKVEHKNKYGKSYEASSLFDDEFY